MNVTASHVSTPEVVLFILIFARSLQPQVIIQSEPDIMILIYKKRLPDVALVSKYSSKPTKKLFNKTISKLMSATELPR